MTLVIIDSYSFTILKEDNRGTEVVWRLGGISSSVFALLIGFCSSRLLSAVLDTFAGTGLEAQRFR